MGSLRFLEFLISPTCMLEKHQAWKWALWSHGADGDGNETVGKGLHLPAGHPILSSMHLLPRIHHLGCGGKWVVGETRSPGCYVEFSNF